MGGNDNKHASTSLQVPTFSESKRTSAGLTSMVTLKALATLKLFESYCSILQSVEGNISNRVWLQNITLYDICVRTNSIGVPQDSMPKGVSNDRGATVPILNRTIMNVDETISELNILLLEVQMTCRDHDGSGTPSFHHPID